MRREKKLERKKKKTTARTHEQQKYRDEVANRPRQCGECRACCYVFDLGEKKKRTWCTHTTDRGCGCYDTRPSVCRDYKCLWLMSALPTAYRPDHCGLVITPRGMYEGHRRVVISETWRNAERSSVGRELVDILKHNGWLIFVYSVDGQMGIYCRHVGIGVEEQEKLMDSLTDDSKARRQDIHATSGDFDFGS